MQQRPGSTLGFVMLRILYCRRFEHAHGSDGGASSGGSQTNPCGACHTVTPPWALRPASQTSFDVSSNRVPKLTCLRPLHMHVGHARHVLSRLGLGSTVIRAFHFTVTPVSPSRAVKGIVSMGRTRGLYRRLVWLMDDDRPAERLMAECMR